MKKEKIYKPNVSIIIPIFYADNELLEKVEVSLNSQIFKGNIEIIKVDKGFGLAKSVNCGIEKSRYDIIVTVHQDCVPIGNEWLTNLVYPLSNLNVVASCSDVFDIENKEAYIPLLDGKGCAYKKDALKVVGYFDEETFLNSGEDMDMYLKLKKIGMIAHPHSIIEHHHKGYLKPNKEKKMQNANSYGCLVRIYGFSMPKWYKGLIKSVIDWDYCYWFWRGFIKKKQDYSTRQ